LALGSVELFYVFKEKTKGPEKWTWRSKGAVGGAEVVVDGEGAVGEEEGVVGEGGTAAVVVALSFMN
jgi:hypothetical protein